MSTPGRSAPTLITGGAGFIGTNLADRLLCLGRPVLIFDNLSRAGVRDNLRWLQEQHNRSLEIEIADIRDAGAVRRAVERAGAVYHLAAQVAVTTSLEDPVHDFEINARGTLNVLEALRRRRPAPPLILTSTNKVYGDLNDIDLRKVGQRYVPSQPAIRSKGVSEARPLSFHSPYGCSKGTADQYVLDYGRCYAMPTVVFRMSCIYGPHQFGTEDQGWVAHFLIQARAGKPIEIFGDGCQVRDVLYVQDLVDALVLAGDTAGRLAGQAFNIGGGTANTLSLLELLALLREERGLETVTRFGPWRNGDQRYYVSDTRRFRAATGWKPLVGASEGVKKLLMWLEESVPPAPPLPRPAMEARQ
jgi:CDP-paratose 2-epimerase